MCIRDREAEDGIRDRLRSRGLGDVYKRQMQERDMNLCVLAKKCGISYSTIQTTARRGGQLSVETIERICLGLGITLKDFFDSSYL